MRSFPTLLLFATLAASAACNGDGSSTNADAAAGACTCKAIQVPFDKGSSSLGATNVQDALDELAARPVPEPAIGTRIKTVTKIVANPGTLGGISVTAACPDEKHDIALGGGCNGIVTGSFLGGDIFNDATSAHYTCGWNQTTGSSGEIDATVVCLLNAK